MDILNQFGVQPILLAAQVVNFFILLFILKKFLYRPVLKVLDERKKRIEHSLKNAEEIEKKLLATEEEKGRILMKANEEAEKIIKNGEAAFTQMIEEGRQKTAVEVGLMIRKGQEAMIAEKEKMQQEIRGELAGIIAVALQKVTGKTVTREDQRRIIEREVKNLS